MKPTRTSVSTDKMQAVTGPPTRIVENDEVRLDPQQVIKAWLESAEVLRDVVSAIRENQADNDFVRESTSRNRRVITRIAVGISILQCISVVLVLAATYSAEQRIQDFVRNQTKITNQVSKEAALTRSEAVALREEGQALTQAMAAFLDASLAREGGKASEAVVEKKMLEAELSVAAVQVKSADTPSKKAKAEVKAQAALQRAKESDVPLDEEVLEGF